MSLGSRFLVPCPEFVLADSVGRKKVAPYDQLPLLDLY
jgi:hypothetical protein